MKMTTMNFHSNQYIPNKYDDDGTISQAYLDYLDRLENEETLGEQEFERERDEQISDE